ncbi:hypothetical protein [Nocardia callitridis]|uniref:HicB family protein n=1 Tax=Nocardia callitridis TaxID=648753 RepID=A0ABP9KTC7_9NOCA
MTYKVHVTGRDGRWWAVTVPELGEDALTQARRLAEVEEEARDYIAVTMDVAPSTVEVEVVIDDLGSARNVQERSTWIKAARQLIEQLEQDVQRETKILADELTSEKIPMREIAELVGTTFQRVGQIANTESSPRRSAWSLAAADPTTFDHARRAFAEVSRLASGT